jgi:hypothetical protein
MKERFFYHSFPRRKLADDAVPRGLAILRSMARSGLLLTPEQTVWSEFLQNGKRSDPIQIFQIRACFTELNPEELMDHAKQFGSFSIEFEIESLRLLGAMPVFYLPSPGSEERALGGIAGAFVARMEEIQRVLARLADLQKLAEATPNKAEKVKVTVDNQPVGMTRCAIGDVQEVLSMLLYQTQPAQELLNAFRALSGFFYPTEDMKYTGELAYYRQREWRIISAMIHRRQEISRSLTAEEISILLTLDQEFFAKRIRFPTGEFRRVDQCRYLSQVDNRRFLSWSRRVIVPDEAVEAATEILKSAGIDLPVVSVA